MRRAPDALLDAVWLRDVRRERLDRGDGGNGEPVGGAIVVIGRYGAGDGRGRPRRRASARDTVREKVGCAARQLWEAETLVDPWRAASDDGNQVVKGADMPKTELDAVSLVEVGGEGREGHGDGCVDAESSER